jgi:hypothetical protein
LSERELNSLRSSAVSVSPALRFAGNLLTFPRKESTPFAYIIVDGDGAVFQESLIAKGEEGGSIAAHQLQTDIENHLGETFGFQHLNVYVQVICNFDGLSRALVGSGALKGTDDRNILNRFARGFCRAQALYSFTDVGYGKEQADNKVRKLFELMAKNLHCRAVFLAGCHDNGYAPFLESFRNNRKVCLLETTPAAAEMRKLSFPKFSCPSVFRSEPLTIKPPPPPGFATPQQGPPATAGYSAPPVAATMYSTQPAPNHIPSPTQLAVRPAPREHTSTAPAPHPAVRPAPREHTSTAPAPQPKKENERPAPGSWAAVSAPVAAAGRSIDISTKKAAIREKAFYLLNKNDQRLDAPLPKFDSSAREAFDEKVRKNGANYCNRYHILGSCKQFDSTGRCPYVHSQSLTATELNILRSRARGLVCVNADQCRDVYCTSGHHCANPRTCWYDESCRFYETHGMDIKPTVKRYEDGTSEAYV